ncbi:hypothetical protein Tco_0425324 [Tanacetum coccineum]
MVGKEFRIFKSYRIRDQRYLWPREMVTCKKWGCTDRAGNANAGQGKVGPSMLLMQAQENVQFLDERGTTLSYECDAFDTDVDDEPTAQSIFMANLSLRSMSRKSTSNVLSKAQSYLSNVTPYEQYLSDNDIFGVLKTKLKIYKEQVATYEQRAKFELIEREQRMDDQMHMLIPKSEIKMEENLKRNFIPFKLQLKLTMENHKIIGRNLIRLCETRVVYAQKTKTALGAQNPFYLRQAKKAQPALYDGDELLKPHHVPVIVSTSEEELELAEATRNKLHVKMNDSWSCVEKEAEELKANATPLPVLPPATVYPPNTPVHLVPRTLPTTSQVNIGLYVITQLFWDFEKTCKKRITPTGITEGERGFEQTKRCYLTEVIPFFNLLKEHFEGIQKSLVTEVRAMKAVFENLEAEVDQNETDLRSDFKSRGNTIRELKEKISRLTKKNSDADPIFDLKALVSQNKDLTAKLNALHDLNECFRAENAKVKQHYKELYDSIKITRAKTTDQNNSLLSENLKHLKDQLKENSKCVTIPDCEPKVLTPSRYPIDVEPIPPRLKKNREVHLHYIERLKENVETLREIVEDAKVERPLDTSLASACRYTQHSQELLEYVIGTCPKDFGPRNKQNASTNSLRKKGVTFVEPHETSTHNTPPQVESHK